jgi:hydantoinase/carbamoylase family amidase
MIGEKVQGEELKRWLEGIAAFNATPGEGMTRGVYTPEFQDARRYVKNVMIALGLEVSEDCLGNIFGVYPGTDPDVAPVWTGSHIDTVPNGGKYDGLAGVFAGLEAVAAMIRAEVQPKRAISVNVYAGEEMSRFGVCCIGSRALSGRLSAADLKDHADPDGMRLYDKLKELGYNPDDFDQEFPLKTKVHGSLELHIEQNDKLEKAGVPVGVVTGICAPTNLRCSVTGVQSHAGGTSMADRRDAFMAAAEMSLALERLAQTSDSAYITGTVGEMQLTPGAANVIPGKAEFSVDVRSVSGDDKSQLVELWTEEAKAVAARRDVDLDITPLNDDAPLTCDPHFGDVIREQADALKISHMDLISGPYHDSLMLGDLMPAAMVFIPCQGGISHDRKEAIDLDDLVKGTAVLAESLYQIANE